MSATEEVDFGPNWTAEHKGVTYGPGKAQVPVELADYMRSVGELPPKVEESNEALLEAVALREAGFSGAEGLARLQAMSDEEILNIRGVGKSTLKKIREAQV